MFRLRDGHNIKISLVPNLILILYSKQCSFKRGYIY